LIILEWTLENSEVANTKHLLKKERKTKGTSTPLQASKLSREGKLLGTILQD